MNQHLSYRVTVGEQSPSSGEHLKSTHKTHNFTVTNRSALHTIELESVHNYSPFGQLQKHAETPLKLNKKNYPNDLPSSAIKHNAELAAELVAELAAELP